MPASIALLSIRLCALVQDGKAGLSHLSSDPCSSAGKSFWRKCHALLSTVSPRLAAPRARNRNAWSFAFALPASGSEADVNSIIVSAAAGPLADQPSARALLAKAEVRGEIPVIAVLGVAMGNPLTISSEQAGRDAVALRRAQDGLLTRVFGSDLAHANVKRFDVVPYVALTVTAGQLRALLSDPAVAKVQEDIAVPPDLAQSVPLIEADILHNLGFTGSNGVVAILDTGVQKTHSMISAAKVCRRRAIHRATCTLTQSARRPGPQAGMPA